MKARPSAVQSFFRVILIAILLIALPAGAGSLERISLAADGSQVNAPSFGGLNALSGDGRYVVFASAADNLVAGDQNGLPDIFVRDRQTGVVTRVSVNSNGAEANGPSTASAISDDGHFVVFQSAASNLVVNDTNGLADIFFHDLQSGETRRVSVASDGTQANGPSRYPDISAHGRYLVFESNATNLAAGAPSTYAYVPTISDDGRFVAFTAVNFTNWGFPGLQAVNDVFVRDLQSGTTMLAGVASDGTPANGDNGPGTISGDGHVVAFVTAAGNLVSGDTNGLQDVFIHDLQSGETRRVNVASDGAQADHISWLPHISGDGRLTVFQSSATTLVAGDTNGADDVFMHDRQTGVTTRISIWGQSKNHLS